MREIDEQTGLGALYLRSLLRSQLRIGLVAVGLLAAVLGALPLLFALQPHWGRLRVLAVPLPWLLVGLVIYPVLALGAWWLVHAAERAEDAFREIVDPH